MYFQTLRHHKTWAQPITRESKQRIVAHLRMVSSNSAWGYACKDFAENWQQKSDLDFRELINELKMDIQEGPYTMRTILGKAFVFFRKA